MALTMLSFEDARCAMPDDREASPSAAHAAAATQRRNQTLAIAMRFQQLELEQAVYLPGQTDEALPQH
jgi:hypothetical protein